MLITNGGTSANLMGSRFKPSCNSSRITSSLVIIIDGSDKDTKSKTIPSALGRNLSSSSYIVLIPDLIGRNTKNPIQPATRRVEIAKIIPTIYLVPNLDFDSSS